MAVCGVRPSLYDLGTIPNSSFIPGPSATQFAQISRTVVLL